MLTPKLTNFLNSQIGENQRENNVNLINLVLTTIYILLENCSECMFDFIDTTSKVIFLF